MSYRETPLSFECEGSSLTGVVTTPATDVRAGVIVVVGGPQYRVGSHRQFVLLARALAMAGIACLRFDYRGMGDSEGEVRTFESIDADIGAAVDAFVRQTGLAKLVLWGLCDGASAVMMYAPLDPRVSGVVAVNPWARTSGGTATVRLRHYYLRRLFSGELWTRLLTGKLNVTATAHEVASTVREATNGISPSSNSYLARMQTRWREFGKPMLFILSGNDLTAREFEGWVAADRKRRSLFDDARAERWSLGVADHTFSSREWQDQLARKTAAWVLRTNRRVNGSDTSMSGNLLDG